MTKSNDERELKAWNASRSDVAAGRAETLSPEAHMDRLGEIAGPSGDLLADIQQMIVDGRRQAAAAVNMGLTLVYWRIGQRINAEILQGERAAYGEQIVATLSRQLVAEFGRGYSRRRISDCFAIARSAAPEAS